MTTVSSGTFSGSDLSSRLMRPPLLGAVIFATILAYKPVAHSLLVLQHHFFTGGWQYLVGFSVGLLGFTLIGKGLRQDETTASAMGYMGGSLVWMGWFEYTFDFFGEALGVAPLTDPATGNPVVPPNLLVLEATALPFIAMLILFGANRETRCRLLMWFHRNLKLAPPKPTTGYRRNYAWVTAWETIFVTWAFYLQIIILYDPRIAGIHHWATYTAFAAYGAWGAYLFAKLIKHTEAGAAIRYAIPATNAIWIMIEMASHWRWFEEIWIKPLKYPLPAILFVAAFAAGAVFVLKPRAGGPEMQAAE